MSSDNSQVIETVDVRIVPESVDLAIWQSGPMLQDLTPQTYLDRIFAEVWEEGISVVGVTSKKKEAQKALRKDYIRTDNSGIGWVDSSVVITDYGRTYLGRVVIESWSKDTVVAATGANPDDLISRVLNELDKH